MFCLAGLCCLAPALGAINRYEMREKYNIIGLHQSETAGVKKHFEGKASNEVLGKKDGHGFITVCPAYDVLTEGFGHVLLLWHLCALPREEGD
jgi:hypothetical protein